MPEDDGADPRSRSLRAPVAEPNGSRPPVVDGTPTESPELAPVTAGPAARRRTRLDRAGWLAAVKRTKREFSADNLTDRAAALTYYGVLAMFPGLLVLVAALGLVGESVTDPLIENIATVAPGSVGDILTDGIRGLQAARGSASVLAILGLAGALWSASGYVAAFMRTANTVYDVTEGRPAWKIVTIRLVVTIVIGVMLVVSAAIVVFTGGVARTVGDWLHIGSAAVTAWEIAKWPVLLVLVSLIFALLYWASPNAKQGGFRWITVGGLLAVALWVLASAGFAFYAANFGSYNKTYGTLGGVIVFFVWLWLSNLAVLLGAEFDAELQRGKAIANGHPEAEEPFLELRDTRKLPTG